jgi:hypothetical protein
MVGGESNIRNMTLKCIESVQTDTEQIQKYLLKKQVNSRIYRFPSHRLVDQDSSF